MDEAKETDEPRPSTLTTALIVVNVAVFAAQLAFSGTRHALWQMPESTMRLFGANDSISTIADTRLETLVTSCFLHWSVLHIGLNLLALAQVGRFVERIVGPARFLPLYLASGIVASAASAITGRFSTPRLSAGASGAICGLIGAALVIGWRTQGRRGPLTRGMARWLAILFFVGLIPGQLSIDNAAHAGGTLTGAIIAATWQRGTTYSNLKRYATLAVCILGVIASGVVVYVRDRTDPFLFLDVSSRINLAYEALHTGRCERARTAMNRAMQMDRNAPRLEALRQDFAARCERRP